MNTDSLFKELEPPPGGAERFTQRLDEVAAEWPSARALALGVAAATAAVAIVTAILLLRQPDDASQVEIVGAPPPVDVYNAPELDRLLGRSAAPADLVVTVNMQAANVTEIETTNEKVRIYQIN
jgi:hypothetical protein